MKKLLISVTALSLVAATPAYADRSGDVIGAIIGGIVVGKVLSDNEHNQRHVAVQPVIVSPPPQQVIIQQPVQCVTPMTDSYGYVRYYVVPCPPYVR